MKNKQIYIIVGILVALLIGGFGVWKLVLSNPSQDAVEEEEEEIVLPPVDDSVEVKLVARDDKRAVILTVSNIPDDTTSIEYELSYNTAAGLPKGAIGKIRLKNESSIEREILLGTCSRNVCRYDEGVTEVELVLRFNASDGGASQFQESYEL